MNESLSRAMEESRRLQDRHERAQYEILQRLWDTEQALSNRVRIFAIGVLAVSWGLLLQETGAEEGQGLFDLRLVLGAAVLSIVALVLDFIYFSLRRTALSNAARRGTRALGGSGFAAPLANLFSTLRAAFFFVAAGVLVFAAVQAFLPVVFGGDAG